MKIICINKNAFKIYINKYYYEYNKDTINECIKKVLIILKKLYNLEIYSNIIIKCYINSNYGIIIELDKESDPFSLYTKKTNIELCTYEESRFLYKIDDYFIKENINKYNIYKYNNNYYIELIDDDYLKIIEFTEQIIYGEDIKDIINNIA